MPQFIATCATGLEYILVDELTSLGVKNAKEGLSLVHFEADWKDVYRTLMWSRIASRIYYPIATFDAEDDEALYNHCSIIDWTQHISPDSTFLVHSQSFRSTMSHTKFISQRVKDAIVDYFKDSEQSRPDVDFDEPDVVIHCKIRRNKVTLSVDLAGTGLHRRGYREIGGGAPIKENLASALLVRAGWGKAQSTNLFDPMCGSGTFLIEAAMAMLDIAPGLNRRYLGLYGWKQFDSELWNEIQRDASERKQTGLKKTELNISGSDVNPRAIRNAQLNIAQAGLDDFIKISIAGIDQLAQKHFPENGLLIVNPPYSERLGERQQVLELYSELGSVIKRQFCGWQASVLSPDKDFGHALGIRAKKIYKFNNGSIPCELLNFDLIEKNFLERESEDKVDIDFKSKLSEQAIQLCNRLEKNQARLKKYLNKENVKCYRVYDADLPEYNVAIDVYQNYLHIQEYKPPKTVDLKIAGRRLKEVERVASGLFQLPRNQIFIKQRQQQKGNWQYTGQNSKSSDTTKFLTIAEGGRKFLINLSDYLDTGLFLDHRKTREKIAQLAKGKSLLNLFCYTASVSVYAATAGAIKTTNVDLSRTYLDWGKRNFIENGVNPEKHQFIKANCVEWLKSETQTYDLIFLDPPTFSNSKSMTEHFDIQADHTALIELCVKRLKQGGVLFFSNNFKKFKMQVEATDELAVKEITKQTLTPDFQRNPLHRLWMINRLDN